MKHEKMNVESLLKSQVHEKKTTLEFEDVWSKYKTKQNKSRKFRIPKIVLIACFLLLVAAVPVGASLMNWYNIELVKKDKATFTPDKTPWLKFENYSDYLQTYKQVSLEESEKLAPFKIMRPMNFSMPLEISVGVLSDTGDFSAYWDLFHKEDKWVYIRQTLDERSNQMLNKEEMKVKFNLLPDAEVIPLQETDALAILDDFGDDGIRISMLVKSNDEQVITFEMRGNIGREELIKLANSYTTELSRKHKK